MENSANLKAIVVDDHPLARMAVKNILENSGVSVIAESGDGIDAFQKVTRLQPDLVIIDLDLPNMSGMEVLEKLRRKKFDKTIVMISSKNNFFYGRRCVEAGANALINKKENIENLIFALGAAKNGYCYFPFSINGFSECNSSDEERLLNLSKQEVNVLRLILEGQTNIRIASLMNISNKTVSTYKCRLMEKLNCNSLMELYDFSIRNGLK